MNKLDIINDAFSRCRISGLTRQPNGDDLRLALDRLEDMAAVWAKANICTGYAFEDVPNPNTLHNLPRFAWSAYKANLAILLLADFGKEAHPALVAEAQSSFSRLSSATATVPVTDYPARQPLGKGNLIRSNRLRKYYSPMEKSPTECETLRMIVDEVNDFAQDFSAELMDGETLSSFIFQYDPEFITVTNDAINSPLFLFRADALRSGDFQARLTMTTSIQRKIVRKINFSIEP